MEKEQYIKIPTIPLRGTTIFPQCKISFDVGRTFSCEAVVNAKEKNTPIFLIPQKNTEAEKPKKDDMGEIGVLAIVESLEEIDKLFYRVSVQTFGRYTLEKYTVGRKDIRSNIFRMDEVIKEDEIKIETLRRKIENSFNEYVLLGGYRNSDNISRILSSEDAEFLFNNIANILRCKNSEKQSMLAMVDLETQMETLLGLINKEVEILKCEADINIEVSTKIEMAQRRYYLKEKLKVIKDELDDEENDNNGGGDEDSVTYKLTKKLRKLNLEKEFTEKLELEIKRLKNSSPYSQEYQLNYKYIETCLNLPFDKSSKDVTNIAKSEKILNNDHYGLDKVKERILEVIAVNNLSKGKHQTIICLVGPPGVGKTSIAKSIAKSLNKKFDRISLGGVSDESEIRGHRRTYLGSMPGKIIKAVEKSKVNNPCILLDEIDKMTSNSHGDPSSAMLEVLDGNQNKNFVDNYIEIPFDLSKVMFIATANDISTIPLPLRDRMEIIFLDSYTRLEKFNIAKKYLVKKQIAVNGLLSKQLLINDEALLSIIDYYTKEAGVRELERSIGKLCRVTARKILSDETKVVKVNGKNIEELLGTKKFKDRDFEIEDKIGVVNGLAWTRVGGETMPLEVNVLDGSGKVQLTGNLGDVMKESAQIAISHIRSIAKDYDISSDFYKTKDIHIHVPDGAVPKDGPSAGIALATAILSALTGIKVKGNVAMTGEITLRGNVLPIGGFKEKSIGAHKENMKTIILPYDNISDLDEIDKTIKEDVKFIPVKTFKEVIKYAMTQSK